MKKTLRKISAVLLALVLTLTSGMVISFAADGDNAETTASAETTTSAEAAGETDADATAEKGLSFFERLAKLIYDFLKFMHDQYLRFVVGEDGYDQFDWMFNGNYFPVYYDYAA